MPSSDLQVEQPGEDGGKHARRAAGAPAGKRVRQRDDRSERGQQDEVAKPGMGVIEEVHVVSPFRNGVRESSGRAGPPMVTA